MHAPAHHTPHALPPRFTQNPIPLNSLPSKPSVVEQVQSVIKPFSAFGCIDAAPYYFRMGEEKPLSERAISNLAANPFEALGQDQLEAEARRMIDAPRSFQNIRKLTDLSRNSALPIALRVEAALNVPKSVEVNSVLRQFAKDTHLPVDLRAQCALALFSSLTKDRLLTEFLKDPSLSEPLRLQCLLKIIKHNTQNVSGDLILQYLRPELQAGYRKGIPHKAFMALFFEQIAYDRSWPLSMRAACALKPLTDADHSSLFQEFASNEALAMDLRLVFTAALPEGPHKATLAQSFMNASDRSVAILWASLLPAKEKEEALMNILQGPHLSAEHQYLCVSKLSDPVLKDNWMTSFAQDESLPIELQVGAASSLLKEDLKTQLFEKFSQRDNLPLIWRIHCMIGMPKGSRRNSLLTRFAKDPSLDVDVQFLCLAHMPKGNLKKGLLEHILKNPDLRLKHLNIGLKNLPPDLRVFQTDLAKTLALNPNLSLILRYEAAQLLPDNDTLKQDLLKLITALHARYECQ
jgi:antitoxin component of RelBE/YafQ-DinJ toxin-antitoxin module